MGNFIIGFALKIRFGLRAKLLLLSSFLFTIPWFGYQYVWEMEKYLRFGQEQTLVGTARALATALHERENLFNNQASFLPSVEQGKDLYGYQLTEAIQLDGLHHDWPNYLPRAHFYDEQHQLFSKQPLSHHFKASVAKYDKYLYLFFQVTDDQLVFRNNNSRSIINNDHLALSFSDNQAVNNERSSDNETATTRLQRFIISNKQPGWISAYRISEHEDDLPQPAPQIQGHWRATSQGYNIELRIPLASLGDNIAFAVFDVDDDLGQNAKIDLGSGSSSVVNSALAKNNTSIAAIGSADPTKLDSLGTILVPSPEIERIVNGMRYTNSSIWVVDQHHRVLATAGSLTSASGFWQHSHGSVAEQEKNSLWYQFKQQFLLPLYYQVLTKPPTDFIDTLYDAKHLEGKHIVSALQGKSTSQWRLTTDQQALVLSAAYPIFINNKVKGAVIVEETTNGIRTLRNQALERLFTVILAIMLAGVFAFMLFASRISSRIRNLSAQAEQAIDKQGRIMGKMTPSTTRDEIGDLSRSFTTAVNRLGEYNHYLESMSSRLSHELRTPIAVVKTSLDNLALQHQPINAKSQSSNSTNEQQNAYIQRAQTGINTLNLILTNMSEATRLEQMLANTESITFDFKAVVDGCTQGYNQVFSQVNFKLITELNSLPMLGSPEHVVQLIDKVINNAVEFTNDKEITLELTQTTDNALLYISNNGPLLPAQLSDSIFDSMVSLRAHKQLVQPIKHNQEKQPHLGLGLYMAKLICEFHQGEISAQNHFAPEGVTIKIQLKKPQ